MVLKQSYNVRYARPIFSRALADFQTIVFIILCKLQEPKSLRGNERGLVERRRGPLLFSSFVFFFSLFLFFSPVCRPPAFSRDGPLLNESLKQANKATRLRQSKLEGRNASRKPITINSFFFSFHRVHSCHIVWHLPLRLGKC